MKHTRFPMAFLMFSGLAMGCFPNVWEWEPDLSDGLGYASTDYELEVVCERPDPLEIELGHGEFFFTPMAEDLVFRVYFGLQGGTHVFGALRIRNPELTHPLLEVTFELLDDDECSVAPPDSDPPADPPADQDEGCPPLRTGYRHGLMNATRFLNDAGQMEEAGLLIFHDIEHYGGGTADRVRLTVRDQCGRVAVAERRITER